MHSDLLPWYVYICLCLSKSKEEKETLEDIHSKVCVHIHLTYVNFLQLLDRRVYLDVEGFFVA